MSIWWLFGGLFLQFRSHAFVAAAISVPKYPSSCPALLRDLSALKEALATLWQLRDMPDAQYSPATRAAAVCAWTAMAQELNSGEQEVGESGLDGRLLSGFQKNATIECGAENDDTEILDPRGKPCWHWAYMDCDKELGFSPSQLKEIQQRCPFSCAGCGREASVGLPDGPEYYTLAYWVFTIIWWTVFLSATCIHMKNSSCDCYQRLQDVVTWLKKNSQTYSGVVSRTKEAMLRRWAFLIPVIYIFAAADSARYESTNYPCFDQDRRRFHPSVGASIWLVHWVLPTGFLLPATVVGQRSKTIIGFLITLCLIAREFDNGGWWYMTYTSMLNQFVWRLLPLLIHRPRIAVSFDLLYTCAIIVGYILKFGSGSANYFHAVSDSYCYVWEPTDHMATSSMSLPLLLSRALYASIVWAIIVNSFHKGLELMCAAKAQMESQKKVFLSLMTLM